MDPDRVEKLGTKVLEETRDLRREMNEKFAVVRQEMAVVRQEMAVVRQEMAVVRQELKADIRLVQTATLETAQGLKRVEAKLDETIANHGSRLDKLEGAAE